jgi:hypothetical protein
VGVSSVEQFICFIESDDNLRALCSEESKFFREILDEQINLIVPNKDLALFVKKMIYRDPRLIEDVLEDALSQLKGAMESVDMAGLSKEAHLKSLSKSIVPAPMVAEYRTLNWFLDVKPTNSYILGDVVSFCRTLGNQYKSILAAQGDISDIMLPLSSQHLLVGTRSTSLSPLNEEEINRAIASLSRERIFASQNTLREQGYFGEIGTDTSILSEGQMEKVMLELQREWF